MGKEQKAREDDCVDLLKKLAVSAAKVRKYMDFCVERISDERFLVEVEKAPELFATATLAYAARHKCSVLDATEYVARALAERKGAAVESPQAIPATTTEGEPHEL